MESLKVTLDRIEGSITVLLMRGMKRQLKLTFSLFTFCRKQRRECPGYCHCKKYKRDRGSKRRSLCFA